MMTTTTTKTMCQLSMRLVTPTMTLQMLLMTPTILHATWIETHP